VSSGYIRGGGGVDVDGRLVVRILLGLFVATLSILVAVLTAEAVHDNAQHVRLHRHGIPVNVTVTGCVGLASGTGITVAGYTCRGSFTVNGRTYDDVIGGSADLHQPGDRLRGVTDPSNPRILATAESVASEHPSRGAFVTPALLLLLLVLIVAFAAWRFRRQAPVLA
jgi:hypothetical protein